MLSILKLRKGEGYMHACESRLPAMRCTSTLPTIVSTLRSAQCVPAPMLSHPHILQQNLIDSSLQVNARRRTDAERKLHRRLRIMGGTQAGKRILSGRGETTRPMMEKVLTCQHCACNGLLAQLQHGTTIPGPSYQDPAQLCPPCLRMIRLLHRSTVFLTSEAERWQD